MIGRVYKTEYKDLLAFLFAGLRKEDRVPAVDGFVLYKTLTQKDVLRLRNFKRWVCVSDSLFDEELGRTEIVNMARLVNRSKRKVEFESLSDDEFVYYCKIFIVSGHWEYASVDTSAYSMFELMDSPKRLKEFFALGLNPRLLYLSLVSFARRSSLRDAEGVTSKSYYKLLVKKHNVAKKNLLGSLAAYSKRTEVAEDMRVLRFILDLGKIGR